MGGASGNLRSVKSSSHHHNDYDEDKPSLLREMKPGGVGASKEVQVSSILAFEVAYTILKGSNLMQSLSEENIQIFKRDILRSEGVQSLVSTDMKELLSIAAADRREELKVFSREVVRFGDMCQDPQWHNLDRFFNRWVTDHVTNKQLTEEAELSMEKLANLAKHTSELYHEFETLDRMEMYFRRKLEAVESLHLPRKDESVMMLQRDIKRQRKLVTNLKKKSFWYKSLDEVMEKLVDIVIFIHQAIAEAFEENAANSSMNQKKANREPKRLGDTGLSLHYAKLITQINNIVSRPTDMSYNTRVNLYSDLPVNVKTSLRSRLHILNYQEEMTVHQIKAELERNLSWLVPLATNTTKLHQCFGFIGEWANTGFEFGTNIDISRLQTLYHADKERMDEYILNLIVWLHRLVSFMQYRHKYTPPLFTSNLDPKRIEEDKNLLEQRTLIPGISKSQEYFMVKKKGKVLRPTKSMGEL